MILISGLNNDVNSCAGEVNHSSRASEAAAEPLTEAGNMTEMQKGLPFLPKGKMSFSAADDCNMKGLSAVTSWRKVSTRETNTAIQCNKLAAGLLLAHSSRCC